MMYTQVTLISLCLLCNAAQAFLPLHTASKSLNRLSMAKVTDTSDFDSLTSKASGSKPSAVKKVEQKKVEKKVEKVVEKKVQTKLIEKTTPSKTTAVSAPSNTASFASRFDSAPVKVAAAPVKSASVTTLKAVTPAPCNILSLVFAYFIAIHIPNPPMHPPAHTQNSCR